MVSKCGVHILAIITLCLFIAAAKPAPCASCESSVSDLLKSSKTNRFFRVQVKEVLKVSGKVSLVKAQVTRVVRGPCIDAKEVAIRFSGDVGKPCPNLPTIRPGQVYGMPLTKPGGSIGGVPLYILRPCARHSLWSSYSTSEIQLLNKSSCKGGRPKKPAAPKRRPPSKDQQKQQIPRKTPRPASSYPDKIVMQAPPPPAAALSMPAPTSNPVPMVPKPNTQPKLPPGCPKMCSAGLLSQNNRECGPRPTRKDVTIKPSDNVKAIVEGAGPNKFIYLQPGVYRKGIDSIRPPSGTTLWAIPGTVTFEGGRKPAAITNADGQIDVTIYGIRFNGYAPLGEKGVINAPTNSIADKFDAKSDPLYGFAPGNDWVVDCCEFDRWWTTGARKGVAVKCGTGMVIRGNIFTNGHGNGIGCFARYVEIRGNRFEKLQLGGTYDQFHCAAIKLVSNKGSKVVNNFFEDIGCKAIWLDINCERGYVAHNHGVRIGTSFLHLEIGGAGTVVECNKVEGWGWRERMGPGAWVKSAGIWFSTSGGTEDVPVKQGGVIRGNHLVQAMKNKSARQRSGILDLDQFMARSINKVEAASWGNQIGHIPDRKGSARPGLKHWKSAYNLVYGNIVEGTYRNGIRASSPAHSRPDKTGRWYCNWLEGEFKVSVG